MSEDVFFAKSASAQFCLENVLLSLCVNAKGKKTHGTNRLKNIAYIYPYIYSLL